MSNSNQDKKYYVYTHKSYDEIVYVGISKENSKESYIKRRFARAYNLAARNQYYKKFLETKLYTIKIDIIHKGLTLEEAIDIEKTLIEKYGRKHYEGGTLYNESYGGSLKTCVGSTRTVSIEQRQKLSDRTSIYLYVYDNQGKFLKKIRNIKNAATFCGVTYNAIWCALQNRNITNNFFVFKEYKGEQIGMKITEEILKPINAKKVICISSTGIEKEFTSITDCAKYLECRRESVRDAIKRGGMCKKHKVFIKDNQQPSS